MDKLAEIRDLLNEIQDLDLISSKDQWNCVASNVIKELISLRKCSLPSRKYRPPPSPLSPPSSSASIHSDSLPPSPSTSSSSNSVASVSCSHSSPVYESAAEAFDRQIYSRCVQIVENAQRQGPITMALITLAHHSYSSLVEESNANSDAIKFANWWIKFLDATDMNEFANIERLELFDLQLFAYEKLLYLKDQIETKMKILEKLEQVENISKFLYRAYDSKYLRILEKIHRWLEQFRDDIEESEIHKNLNETLKNGIERARSDKKTIEQNESRPLSFDDPDYDMVLFVPEYSAEVKNFSPTKIAKVFRVNNISRIYDDGMSGMSDEIEGSSTLNLKNRMAFEDIFRIPTPRSYVPSVEENPLSDRMTFMERFVNIRKSTEAIITHLYASRLITSVFRRRVSSDFPWIGDIAKNASLIFVCTDEFLDLPRPISPKTVYIGGLGIIDTAQKPLDQRFSSIMSRGSEGVILFSFGTVVPFNRLEQQIQSAVRNVVQKMSNYHFIVKIDSDDETTKELFKDVKNVDLVEWMPQSDILAHPRLRLFVTHGGINGLLEAIRLAVPLLLVPQFADQFRNAKNVIVFHTLLRENFNEETFEANLREILNNPSYKERAKRMAQLISTKPFSPEERVVRYTEFLLSNGPIDELHLALISALHVHRLRLLQFVEQSQENRFHVVCFGIRFGRGLEQSHVVVISEYLKLACIIKTSLV
ncbi:hypothetical protein WR25_17215 [Diploscapter pachys]|uniref:glucuronosyltransferase n=1 Tax=Diploscapter pachys TaxID=2018661 RepID=A0A2A2JV97_9BILA|nr:hypothetical protein WR25_17215 [Diploscapter pachys]